MKLLVFSDSHSHAKNIEKAIEIHGGVCDFVIFLGDGLRDVDYLRSKYPSLAFFALKGNCDAFMSSDYPSYSVLDLDGKRVLVTHGHLFGVKSGYERIAKVASELGAEAVFFGHTHQPIDDIYDLENGDRIRLFNPGSIGYDGIYGVVNIKAGAIVTSHGKI
ncbi:MAG: YfcE family phosphodiesterase [Clostridia bacterium]|nr:YfcE family phosphodiesterase [Clostridia bacterium]